MLDKQLDALVRYNDPIHHIESKEFNLNLIRFGSFVSIIQNKKLSQTFVLLQLFKNKELREIFQQMCEVESFQKLLSQFLECYPVLAKSKIVKLEITRLFKNKKFERW